MGRTTQRSRGNKVFSFKFFLWPTWINLRLVCKGFSKKLHFPKHWFLETCHFIYVGTWKRTLNIELLDISNTSGCIEGIEWLVLVSSKVHLQRKSKINLRLIFKIIWKTVSMLLLLDSCRHAGQYSWTGTA